MSKSDLRGNKIIWFLVGNPTNFASSRIHGFNVHKELLRKSYNSIIAYDSINTEEEIPIDRKQFREFRSFITKGDVVVLQKIKKESNIEFITFLKTEGIRIIFIDCDMPLAISIARLADITICPSELLVQKYSERGIVSKYIEDSPESYFEKTYIEDKAELTCYWFGDGRPNK